MEIKTQHINTYELQVKLRKFIAMNAYIQQEMSQVKNPILYLKKL